MCVVGFVCVRCLFGQFLSVQGVEQIVGVVLFFGELLCGVVLVCGQCVGDFLGGVCVQVSMIVGVVGGGVFVYYEWLVVGYGEQGFVQDLISNVIVRQWFVQGCCLGQCFVDGG